MYKLVILLGSFKIYYNNTPGCFYDNINQLFNTFYNDKCNYSPQYYDCLDKVNTLKIFECNTKEDLINFIINEYAQELL